MLILEKPRTRQPQGAVGIDGRSQLSKGLAFAWTPTIGLKRPHLGLEMTVSGAVAPAADARGIVADIPNTAYLIGPANRAQILTSDGAGGGDFSILVWHKTAAAALLRALFAQRSNTASTYRQCGIFANDNGGSTASGYLAFRTYDSAFSVVSVAGKVDGLWRMSLGVRSGADLSLYNDGLLLGSASGTVRNIVNTDSQFGIGVAPPAFNPSGDVKIALVAAWNRALTAAEAVMLSNNPWQIFAPRRIYIPTAAAAAGGSFQAAWARNRNTVIGSGVIR